MRAALEPWILILCPLAREWSFLVKTFEASRHVEHLHDLKIEAAYNPDWRPWWHRVVMERHCSAFGPNT
jgi:hypothetical protein